MQVTTLYAQYNYTAMHNILISYAIISEIVGHPQYKITACGKLINSKTGRIIRRIVVGGSKGYIIAGRFTPESKLQTQQVQHQACPF